MGRPTVSRIEERSVLLLATSAVSTASGCCRYELNASKFKQFGIDSSIGGGGEWGFLNTSRM
jgi:hypothetical protein